MKHWHTQACVAFCWVTVTARLLQAIRRPAQRKWAGTLSADWPAAAAAHGGRELGAKRDQESEFSTVVVFPSSGFQLFQLLHKGERAGNTGEVAHAIGDSNSPPQTAKL
eukprot:3290805-Rhodomonas_salina.1